MSPKLPSNLTCEICSGTDFDEVWLPDPQGMATIRSGLLACRQCRLVFAPKPTPIQLDRKQPLPPDWARYGPPAKI